MGCIAHVSCFKSRLRSLYCLCMHKPDFQKTDVHTCTDINEMQSRTYMYMPHAKQLERDYDKKEQFMTANFPIFMLGTGIANVRF